MSADPAFGTDTRIMRLPNGMAYALVRSADGEAK